MARPTTYATPICLGLSVVAAIGIIVGLTQHSPLAIVLALIPTVAYEVYRVEGDSTRWASWAMAGVLVALFVFTVFKVDVNFAEFLGQDEAEVGGYLVPLGDIKTVGAAMLAAIAVLLFTRTRGIYTRWLAGIVFASVAVLVYVLNPEVFSDLVRQGTDTAVNNL